MELLIPSLTTIQATQWLYAWCCLPLAWMAILLVRDIVAHTSVGAKWGILAVLGLAVGCRVAWMVWLHPEPLSDFGVYWDFANAFLAGQLDYPEISRHPGVAVVSSLLMPLFGHSLWTVWGFNLAMSGLWLLAMFRVAQQLGGNGLAWLAVVLVAIFPQTVAYSALVATEIPTLALMTLLLWGLLWWRQSDHTHRPTAYVVGFWMSMGMLSYAAALYRSSTLLGVVMTLGVLLWQGIQLWRQQRSKQQLWRTVALPALVLGLTTSIMLSTWVAHQYLRHGQAKLFWGIELWLSSAIQAHRGGRYTDLNQMAFYPKVKPYWESGPTQNMVKAYQVIGEESLNVIRSNPGAYLAGGLIRLKNIMWTAQTGLRWSEQGAIGLSPAQHKVINRLSTGSTVLWQVMLALTPVGLWALWRKSGGTTDGSGATVRRQAAIYLSGYLAIWLVFHYLVAVASERYGVQLVPFVLWLGGFGLMTVLRPLWYRALGLRFKASPVVQVGLMLLLGGVMAGCLSGCVMQRRAEWDTTRRAEDAAVRQYMHMKHQASKAPSWAFLGKVGTTQRAFYNTRSYEPCQGGEPGQLIRGKRVAHFCRSYFGYEPELGSEGFKVDVMVKPGDYVHPYAIDCKNQRYRLGDLTNYSYPIPPLNPPVGSQPLTTEQLVPRLLVSHLCSRALDDLRAPVK